MTATPQIQVILCTHNPDAVRLRRTLEGLKEQGLPLDQWGLICVDNRSDKSPVKDFPLDWHPQGRWVQEEKLGLTEARMRGFREASAPLLVMVDDDNVLAPDYLECAIVLAEQYPWLGAFGGSLEGEYERPLPSVFSDKGSLLAVRPCKQAEWGNQYGNLGIVPFGAGMCMRREVVDCFLEIQLKRGDAVSLDRKGSSLSGAGDLDIAYCALDLSYGIGRFPQLKLTHLIAASRCEPGYLLRIAEGSFRSNYHLNALRKETKRMNRKPSMKGLVVRVLCSLPRGGLRVRMSWAEWKGARQGYEETKSI